MLCTGAGAFLVILYNWGLVVLLLLRDEFGDQFAVVNSLTGLSRFTSSMIGKAAAHSEAITWIDAISAPFSFASSCDPPVRH